MFRSEIILVALAATFAPCTSLFSGEEQSHDEKHHATTVHLIERVLKPLNSNGLNIYKAAVRSGDWHASARLLAAQQIKFPANTNHVLTIERVGNDVSIRQPSQRSGGESYELNQVTRIWDTIDRVDNDEFTIRKGKFRRGQFACTTADRNICFFLYDGGAKLGALTYRRSDSCMVGQPYCLVRMAAPEVMHKSSDHSQIHWSCNDKSELQYIVYDPDPQKSAGESPIEVNWQCPYDSSPDNDGRHYFEVYGKPSKASGATVKSVAEALAPPQMEPITPEATDCMAAMRRGLARCRLHAVSAARLFMQATSGPAPLRWDHIPTSKDL